MTMKDELASVREAMVKLYRKHDECEDCWYSCPKSADGCCNDAQGDECNCGAEKHNAILDAIISSLSKIEEGMGWIPVSERLPDNLQEVLVAVSNALPGRRVQMTEWRYYDDESNAFLGMKGYEVTHWMPLPTPPDTQQP